MDGLFSETIFGVPWVVVAAIALVVGVAFVVIDTGASAMGWRWFVLRWFHPLCWLFLASGALIRSKVTPVPVDWSGSIAAIGGVLYAIFLIFWVMRPKG